MSPTVSYANVAAKGESPVESADNAELQQRQGDERSSDVKADAEVDSTAANATEADSGVAAEVADAEAVAAGGEGDAPTDASAVPAPRPAKKTLAPAPVPAKSAWGSSMAAAASAAVDEHKWPTPDKISEQSSSQQPQKFIKPITNKWVPINAKVVLPTAKSGPKVQNRNRKNKKPLAVPGLTQPPLGAPAQPLKKLHKKKEDEEADAAAQPEAPGADAQSAAKAGFKRFPNSAPQGAYKPRYASPPNGGQFSQPQPFNPNYQQAPYGNFNNRGYRQNGAYPAQGNGYKQVHKNGAYRTNGFVPQGTFIPPQQQVQIPPPISPKQDPQQALVQQINYYFSLENLIRDIFLRKNMAEDGGWVPLGLILEFKRVKIIVNGIQNSSEEDVDADAVILESVTQCDNLEVRYVNDKLAGDAQLDDVELRVKENYQQWLLPA